MKSYKNISRIVTVLSFIAIFIVTNKDFLISSVPIEYQTLVQLIVLVAGFFVTQFSEEKRVVRAEELGEGSCMSDNCMNENRIIRLEERVDKKHDEIDSLKKELIQDREELKDVLVTLTQLSTTLNTLKWIIVVFISAFGGIVVFLFQELVKLI